MKVRDCFWPGQLVRWQLGTGGGVIEGQERFGARAGDVSDGGIWRSARCKPETGLQQQAVMCALTF